MKTPLVVCLAGLFVFAGMPVLVAQEPASRTSQTVGKMYLDGQALVSEGKFTEARVVFEEVLMLQPGHAGARNSIQRLERQNRGGGDGSVLKAKMDQLIIQDIDLKNATLESVLQFLPQLAERESKGTLKANFVAQLDPSILQKRITLTLRNAPYTEVLRYIGELSGVTFRPEQYAIVAIPSSSAASPAPVPADASAPTDTDPALPAPNPAAMSGGADAM